MLGIFLQGVPQYYASLVASNAYKFTLVNSQERNRTWQTSERKVNTHRHGVSDDSELTSTATIQLLRPSSVVVRMELVMKVPSKTLLNTYVQAERLQKRR